MCLWYRLQCYVLLSNKIYTLSHLLHLLLIQMIRVSSIFPPQTVLMDSGDWSVTQHAPPVKMELPAIKGLVSVTADQALLGTTAKMVSFAHLLKMLSPFVGCVNLLLCTECPVGYYGPGCLTRCSCHPDASCDPQTGHCVCPSGKKGHDCATCKHSFEHLVNVLTRVFQITHNFTLLTLIACGSGHWGRSCLRECQCKDSSLGCDPATGRCVCEAGFTGDHCERSKYTSVGVLFSECCHHGVTMGLYY